MKAKTLRIDLITHDRKRLWQWKPWFIKSHIVYEQGGKAYLAPMWETGWLFLVFHWTAYDKKVEYKDKYSYHECPAELMQERINELETIIYNLKTKNGL